MIARLLFVMTIAFSLPALAEQAADCEAALTKPALKTRVIGELQLKARRFAHFLKGLFPKSRSNSYDAQPSSSRENSYQAHNKNTDQGGRESGPLKESVRVIGIQGLALFRRTIYQNVNPRTGELSARPIKRKMRLTQSSSAARIRFTATADYPLTSGFAPLVPEGYDLANSDEFILDETGNYRFTGRSSPSSVEVSLVAAGPVSLSDQEEAAYTTLENSLEMSVLPEWIRAKVMELRERQGAGVTDVEIARDLVRFLRKGLIYRVDQDEQVGVEAWLLSKKCQCDGAAVIAVSILRQFFKIPSRPVTGFTGAKDKESPADSVVALPTQGHMWIEVYDSKSRIWIAMDPTAEKPDREKEKKEENSDGRYQNLPGEGEAEGEAENEDQKEKSDGSSDNGYVAAPRWKEEFDQLLAKVDSPGELKAALEELARKLGESNNQKLKDTVRELNQAVSQIRGDSWTSAVNELMAKYNPQQRDTELSERMQQLHSVLSAMANSSHHSASTFRQLALQVQRILPSKVADADSPVAVTRKILKGLQNRPLETEWLHRNYPGLTGDVEAAEKFLNDLAGGRLGFMMMRGEVDEYLDLALLRTPRQTREYLEYGRPQPFGSDEMVIRETRDFDRPESFYRDGTPPSLDYFRAMSGDLMELLYKEQNEESDSTALSENFRTLTFLLTDMSGSNNYDQRGLIRDALIVRYMDYVAGQFDIGNTGSHLIHIPYSDNPAEPVVLSNRAALSHEFDQWAAGQRINANGNNTAKAIVKALQLAAANPDFARVNIVLITDGEETIDTPSVLKAQKALPANIEVNLLALTLVTGNVEIQKLSDSFFAALPNPTQGPRLHHISAAEVARVATYAFQAGGKHLKDSSRYNWSGWNRGADVARKAQRLAAQLDRG